MNKKGFLFFLLGSFVGFLPYLIMYKFLFLDIFPPHEAISYFISGPQNPSLINSQPIIANQIMVWSGFNHILQVPQIMLRLLIYPYRGLFIYSPLLIFAIPGIFLMIRSHKWKNEGLIFLGMFLVTILLISLFPAWWGNFSFGPRKLILIMPFLVIGSAFFVEKKKINWKIIFSIILISVSINFLGLQEWEAGLNYNKVNNGVQNWEPLGNPVINRYIPLFIRNGPRSILFENIVLEGKLDIWSAPQTCKSYKLMPRTELQLTNISKGIIVLRLPFLALFILILLLLVIWRRELLKRFPFIKNHKVTILIVILLTFLVLFVRVRKQTTGDGWEPIYNQRNLQEKRIMKQNGTIYVYSSRKQIKNLNFKVKSLVMDHNLELYINENKIGEYKIHKGKLKIIERNIQLNKGVNILKFHSKEGCKFPKPEECNVECVSFSFNNIQIK